VSVSAPAPRICSVAAAGTPPAEVAAGLRRLGVPGVGLLESGLDLDGLGRASLVVARPVAVAVAEAGRDLELVAGPAGLPPRWPGDPLRAAADLSSRLRPPGWRAPPAGCPFAGGAVLTLSYDLGRRFERLPARAAADARAPDLHVAVYEGALAWDGPAGPARVGRGGPTADELAAALARARRAPREDDDPPDGARSEPGPVTFSPDGYRRAVERARGLIRRGDLFEVNLSRRWSLPGLEPERCYRRLRRLAPAPFMADLDLGAGRRLLSASPERFLSLRPDGRAASWPIKGTRPRGASPEEDARLRRELLASAKEGAELAMIVDLVRSDLGRVARPGSVRVRAPRLVQTWPTVHHTVGVVEADLEPGRDWADLVRAAFPPGSVTGAPKVRAMEVIDELEPVRRGLYCGAFGYAGWDGALDLAVGIRVLALEPGRAFAHAGGAVLLDSTPAGEEAEGRAKARALLGAARGAEAP